MAGQVARMMLGLQDEMNWDQVGMGAIGGAVSGGVGSAFSGAAQASESAIETAAIAAAQAAVSNAATQGIACMVGLQKDFSWSAVATSALTSAAGSAASSAVGAGVDAVAGDGASQGVVGRVLASTASGMASSVTASLVRGGKIDMVRIAADSFGNALGSALGEAIKPKMPAPKAPKPEPKDKQPWAIPAGPVDPAPEAVSGGWRPRTGSVDLFEIGPSLREQEAAAAPALDEELDRRAQDDGGPAVELSQFGENAIVMNSRGEVVRDASGAPARYQYSDPDAPAWEPTVSREEVRASMAPVDARVEAERAAQEAAYDAEMATTPRDRLERAHQEDRAFYSEYVDTGSTPVAAAARTGRALVDAGYDLMGAGLDLVEAGASLTRAAVDAVAHPADTAERLVQGVAARGEAFVEAITHPVDTVSGVYDDAVEGVKTRIADARSYVNDTSVPQMLEDAVHAGARELVEYGVRRVVGAAQSAVRDELGLGGEVAATESDAVKREAAKTTRSRYEKAEGKPWPRDPETGRYQDVAHLKALADGGTNELSNVKPQIHSEHVREHSENGDFRRWALRKGK